MFLLHGVHHLQPNCKERLVMPPFVSAPIGVLFYFLFKWVFVQVINLPQWFEPMFAGIIAGYVIYDMTHYAVHHLPMKGRFLKALKRHHMLHHFQDPNTRYGVTSPMWDVVFGTQPDEFFKKQ
jgi:sterol desaturase/sphingolipid hydroxylase (fatty acid hydroxylase superfamily)